jgi:hypothetical protein
MEQPNLPIFARILVTAQLRKDRKVTEMMVEPPSQEPLASLVTSDGQPYSAHQTERYERYQQVVTLRDQGVKIKEIAKRVGIVDPKVKSKKVPL